MNQLNNYELRITNYELRRAFWGSCVLMFLFSTVSLTAAATTLSQYHAKIHNAKQSIDVLLYSDEDESNTAENLSFKRQTLKSIRANLPPTERVATSGGEVEVENTWLAEKLAAFEKETDSSKCAALLTEISARLGALETKLTELENAAATGRAKDEDKQKLAEILRRAEYQKPVEKGESFLHRMWREFWEWLKNLFPARSPVSTPVTGFQNFSFVLQLIIYGLVLGIIGFLIYRFAPFLRGRFKRRVKKKEGTRIILGETLAEGATGQNLFSEAERLAREGNLRAAIRKGYIALLCELSDRRIIGLAQHKTNRDYLHDVSNQRELHQNMNNLTGSFERYWYGFEPAQQKDWEAFRAKYKQTVNE